MRPVRNWRIFSPCCMWRVMTPAVPVSKKVMGSFSRCAKVLRASCMSMRLVACSRWFWRRYVKIASNSSASTMPAVITYSVE